MSGMGQTQTSGRIRARSVLPPTRDMRRLRQHVRLSWLPEADIAQLLDHLIGAGKQRRGHNETDGLRRPEVDDKFEFGWLLDRQIARL